jgi:REP element-mobilizing transposase RayT
MTFCVEGRKHVLNNAVAWHVCVCTFEKLDRWQLLAAVAMPDHLHILVSPQQRDGSITAFAKWFKRWFNEAFSLATGRHTTWRWQEGCFDRLLRSNESAAQKWEYLRQNPVRAGLVTDADEWPYQLQL